VSDLRVAEALLHNFWVDPLVFLVRFGDARERNKTLAENQGRVADHELILYDRYDRNIDDQASLEGRYEVLRQFFE
jgi:hypothetical protein